MKNTLPTLCLLLGATMLQTACTSTPEPKQIVLEPQTSMAHPDAEADDSRLNFQSAPKSKVRRSELNSQKAIDLANHVWTNGDPSGAQSLAAARALANALESRDYHDSEEQMMLAVMTIQMAILSQDRESLGTGLRNWEAAYHENGRVLLEGEVDTYILGLALNGETVPHQLAKYSNPNIRELIANLN